MRERRSRGLRGISAVCAAILVLLAGCSGLRIQRAMNEGNRLYKAQKYEDAIKEYAKILAIQPDHWDANYLTAVSYVALYHPGSTHPKDREYSDKAIATLEKLMTLTPPGPEAEEKVEKYYLSILTAAEKQDKAATFLEKKLAQDPKNASLIQQLATLYAKQGDFANAVKYYERRTQVEPNNKEAWYTLGVVNWERSYKGGVTVSHEEKAQVVENGLAALQKALALDPEYFDALAYTNLLWREKAKVLQEEQKYEEVQQAIAKAEEFTKKAVEVRKKQQAAEKAASAS